MTELRKWSQTIQIALANHLAYKSDVILQIIGPAVVFFFVKYQLWSSIYAFSDTETLKGYTFRAMIEYQAWVMLVSFLSQSYNSRNLAEDIRLGRITAFLLYPFEFWKFHAATFFAFQIVQLFIVALTTAVFFFLGIFPNFSLTLFVLGAAYSIYVGLLWFTVHFTLGLLAFWLDETWMLRVTFIIIVQFFSGGVIPLELFPETVQWILSYLPFPYMTYVPVKVLMGTYDGSLALGFGVVTIWMCIIGIIGKLIWNSGMRLYSAAGM